MDTGIYENEKRREERRGERPKVLTEAGLRKRDERKCRIRSEKEAKHEKITMTKGCC